MIQCPVRVLGFGAILLLVACSANLDPRAAVAPSAQASAPEDTWSTPPGAPAADEESFQESRGPSGPAEEPPRTSSGDLDAATVPAPSDLGAGWVTRVEGGGAEDGPGNGTPYQERDPVEIVQTTIPLGCAQRSPSPVPANVLQATYRHPSSGAYAVLLRMRFASQEQARQFVALRHADLVACGQQPDDPYSGASAPVRWAVAEGQRTVAKYVLFGERRAWRSGALVDGSDVLTLDSDSRSADQVAWRALGFLDP